MERPWMWVGGGLIAAVAGASVGSYGCSGEAPPPPVPAPPPVAPAPPPPRAAPAGPLPALIMVQAQFVPGPDGKPKPGPAKMTILRTDGRDWFPEVIEDPESNVFHKGLAWRDGILTIGAENAVLRHWTRQGDAWAGRKLWEKEWGGRFDRLRDIEISDVDGDGKEEILLVTHDQGVVAVGDEGDGGAWTFLEMDQTPDTFVHEVEVGDVDGDKKPEFYVTPSERNKASGVSQPGGVARYDFRDGKYVRTEVAAWTATHAKEILVADLDGDGVDELYVAKEGEVVKGEDKKAKLVTPATIARLVPGKKGAWKEEVVATLADEKQCRFLVAGDVNGDGTKDLVAAAMETGLWVLDRKADGTFAPALVDASSGGFEHATDVADLDGDGKLEIYAAAEKCSKNCPPGQREVRKYWWDGAAWQKAKVVAIPEQHITWSLSDARL